MPRTIRVEKAKYDGTIQAAWESELLDHAGSLLRSIVPGGRPVYVPDRSRWVESGKTTRAVELYFEDRWYNVWHFPDDTTDPLWFKVLWYCNVALPASFDGKTLRWVDLDIDIRCHRDGVPEVLDEDEFEQHRVEFGYPDEVVERALAARDEALRLAQARVFPFDYETQISALRR